MLEKNKTLTDLRLAGNSIPSNLQAEIDRLLEENQIGTLHEDYSNILSPHQQSEFESQRDDTSHIERHANLQYELSKLRSDLEELKEDSKSLQAQKEATDSQLEVMKNELREESLLRKCIEKEGQEFKEQAMKAREDLIALEERLYANSSTQNAVLMEAKELHAAAISECQALQDQILRLREDHSSELRNLAERARKEAEYNISLLSRMDTTIREHDQLYMDEINNLRARLSAESQAREDLLRDSEKHSSQIITAEQNWLQEKDAHQQALSNLGALNSEYTDLQNETHKLMKQLSKTKRLHAAEVEEFEKTIAYQKQLVNRAELAKSEFAAERTKEERKIWEKEMLSIKNVAELSQKRLQELEAGIERRKYDDARKLHEAEAIITDSVRQQFEELRAISGTRVLKFSQ